MFSRFKESVINSINPSPIIDQSVSIPSSLPRSRSSPLSSLNHHQTIVSNSNQTIVSNSNQTTVSSVEEKRRLYTYTRPRFLNLKTEDEIQVTADHSIRPIIVPRVKDSSLPFNTGYAECINGGKSVRNEDQACVYTHSLTVNEDRELKVRDRELKVRDRELEVRDRELEVRDRELEVIVTRNGRQNPLPGRSQSMNFNGSSLDGIKENGLVPGHGDDQDGVGKRTATRIEEDLREGGKEKEQKLIQEEKEKLEQGEKEKLVEGEKEKLVEGEKEKLIQGEKENLIQGEKEKLVQEETNPTQIPWTYFALFDGHAGPAVAVASSATLHSIIQSKLESISHLLLHLHDQESASHDQESESTPSHDQESGFFRDQEPTPFRDQEPTPFRDGSGSINGFDSMTINSDQANSCNQNQANPKRLVQTSLSNPKRLTQTSLVSPVPSLTVESLIIGALESSFWEMDQLIERDKRAYQSPVCSGGCTVLVSLFILGRVFVANAGDSRAVLLTRKFSTRNGKEEEKREEISVRPVSFDFTPESERERIKMTALINPSLIGRHFSPVEFLRRPTRQDLGQQLLVRDVFMNKGWTLKTVTHGDLGKIPLISGSGKRSRLLGTIGVTRGFGDHELKASNFSSEAVFIKPFLSPQPEVRIIDLRSRSHSNGGKEEDMERILIMGTDGLWDVTTNEKAAATVSSSLDSYSSSSVSGGLKSDLKSDLQEKDILNRYRYISAAQDLVMASRGKMRTENDSKSDGIMTGSSRARLSGVRLSGSGWRTGEGKAATVDDISVFVIPLEEFARESRQWVEERRRK